MGIQGQTVFCDAYGCHRELGIPAGSDPRRAIEDHPEWTSRDGAFRCPDHPFTQPRLS